MNAVQQSMQKTKDTDAGSFKFKTETNNLYKRMDPRKLMQNGASTTYDLETGKCFQYRNVSETNVENTHDLDEDMEVIDLYTNESEIESQTGEIVHNPQPYDGDDERTSDNVNSIISDVNDLYERITGKELIQTDQTIFYEN